MVEQKSFQQIANELKLSKSTVQTKINRAMSSGGKSASRIVLDKKYFLFNKKLVKFPDDTDKWSGKVASNIRTDWKKGTKYKRASLRKIRSEYEKNIKLILIGQKIKLTYIK
ncbi:hypothetical protein [Rummeliibacillus stabekisii]|uniref:Uncharacterized protein n=1 Tax=Rummeliibacillus stabekisii TaxID=241244 RepID=A0A143HCD5_9BACL|nr:hypothetical protein [Rummeliibacillus stabekisii]AMW99362.1 hypothetical protein ATY39_07715 [Rummeliibacillus stabekisii]